MGIIKDPTSWRAGFELGLAGFSFPYSKPRKPIAYLYNGIRLPALPEWDRGVYPYAVMSVFTEETSSNSSVGDISLCVCVYPLSFNGSNVVQTNAPERTKYLLYRYSPTNGDTGFSLAGEYSGGTSNKVTYPSEEDSFWSNHDIPNADGTIYLAGSDPIPVYEQRS